MRFKLEAQQAPKLEIDKGDKEGGEPDKLKDLGGRLKKPVERHKSEGGGVSGKEEEKEKDSPLPPTLHHLVYFWEELSTTVLRVISQELG